ncbi:DUF4192 domain-containing protein [Streptomyces sp. NBC_01304]|uniref:DUF4192 domain-containing protein n=1 Tax=Streptomyces sp. NBC_01304 TaxID=2903818 RepID=UPI002E11D5D7|nr:DUF4192 domain-containing protein [Streptomyces sp. NBC_01304]
MTHHSDAAGGPGEQTIGLRGPGELADALPYFLGFHPDDSVVLIATHGERGRFGGRVRLGIPEYEEDWPEIAVALAKGLVTGSERRSGKPDGIVVFLCRDPAPGGNARQVMERLRPLAQALRLACGGLDVPVYEALCLSGGRYWSYVNACDDPICCSPDGTPVARPGTSAMAAAAAYAGLQAPSSLREMERRLMPLEGAVVADQEQALDAAAIALVPRILEGDRGRIGTETLEVAERVMARLGGATAVGPGVDARDDTLLSVDEAAALILGLQDRDTRDRAAACMEGEGAAPALRLWRALARRCVGPYVEHAAAPLTLAGWVHWSLGQEPEARVALRMALRIDPEYTFAQLLHQACNEGLDPETIRNCLRRLPAGSGAEFPWEDGAGPSDGRAERGVGGAVPAGRDDLPSAGPDDLPSDSDSAATPAPDLRAPASRGRTRPPAPKGSRRPEGPQGRSGERSGKGASVGASSRTRKSPGGRGAAGER